MNLQSMTSFPSCSIVNNNESQYYFQNDPSLTIPILISFQPINIVTPYGPCIGLASPIALNIPNNYFQINQEVKYDLPQQLTNSLSSNTIPNSDNDTKSNDLNVEDKNNACSDLSSKQSKKTPRIHFTKKEDEKIKELVDKFGKKNWSIIASFLKGRSAKQCRDRYCNYLIPGFFQGEWSKEEDELLVKLYKENGSKWSIIQSYFPKRSSNSIKNRWYYFLRKEYSNDEIQNKGNDKETKINLEEFEIIEDENSCEKHLNETSEKSSPPKNIIENNNSKNNELESMFEIDKEMIENLNENEWIAFE